MGACLALTSGARAGVARSGRGYLLTASASQLESAANSVPPGNRAKAQTGMLSGRVGHRLLPNQAEGVARGAFEVGPSQDSISIDFTTRTISGSLDQRNAPKRSPPVSPLS